MSHETPAAVIKGRRCFRISGRYSLNAEIILKPIPSRRQ